MSQLTELKKRVAGLTRQTPKHNFKPSPMPKLPQQYFSELVNIDKFYDKESYQKDLQELLADAKENLQTAKNNNAKDLIPIYEKDVKDLNEIITATKDMNWQEVLTDRVERYKDRIARNKEEIIKAQDELKYTREKSGKDFINGLIDSYKKDNNELQAVS